MCHIKIFCTKNSSVKAKTKDLYQSTETEKSKVIKETTTISSYIIILEFFFQIFWLRNLTFKIFGQAFVSLT